ncbi:carboxypeptidase regulatory-like domain-containing protein [candidate division KSB1 bacterium]|nr:carboxypeptidase regulatory-like domain-containing protein [candidate division KSB1 bacterium]
MKRRLFLILFTVVLILSINNVYSGDTGTIAGKVIDAKTGKGLRGARVYIMKAKLKSGTNSEGEFLITNVPPGKYTVRGDMHGYKSEKISNVRSDVDHTTSITIELETDLTQTSIIIVTGTILDEETRKPISGARIIIDETGTESDNNGHFIFPMMMPKVYTIKAIANGYKTEYFHNLVLSPGPRKNLTLSLEHKPILESETFFVKHKPTPEIYHLVKPIVSKHGRIKSGGSNSFTVTDERANLKKIKELVNKYDIPPKQVWLEVRLILASSEKKQSQKMPKELETIAKQLKTLFRYQGYEILDDARVLAYENKECFSLIGEGNFQMKINKLEYQDVNGGLIKLNRFSLTRGNQNMLATTVNIPNGDTVILGASNVDGGGKALITAVTARILK